MLTTTKTSLSDQIISNFVDNECANSIFIDNKMSQHSNNVPFPKLSQQQQSSQASISTLPTNSTKHLLNNISNSLLSLCSESSSTTTKNNNNDNNDDNDDDNCDNNGHKSPSSTTSSSSLSLASNNPTKMINELKTTPVMTKQKNELFDLNNETNLNENDDDYDEYSNNSVTNDKSNMNISKSEKVKNCLKNKRKNFKPRCIENQPESIDCKQNRAMMNESSSSISDEQQYRLFQNLIQNNNSLTNNNNNSGGSSNSNSSLITNSILQQLFNDMNYQQQQQQNNNSQQQQQQPNQPLDLSDQQQQQQMQQLMLQQIHLQMQQQQQQQQSKNHLFELFLMKSMRNQFQQQQQQQEFHHTLPKESIQSSSSSISIIDERLQSTKESMIIDSRNSLKSNQSLMKNDDNVVGGGSGDFSMNNDPNFMDHLLQLYSFNRENYLKFLQQQIPQLSINQSTIRMIKNDDDDDAHQQQLSSTSSSLFIINNNQKILVSENDDFIDENTNNNDNQRHHHHHHRRSINPYKTAMINDQQQQQQHSSIIDSDDFNQQQQQSLNVDKLKQLQQFYNKFNLMQHLDGGQQQQQSTLSSKLNPFAESILLSAANLVHKSNNDDDDLTSNGNNNDNLSSSTSTSMSMVNNKSEIKIDNITYVKDLFRNKVINAKSSSRRPLSSWKQSINACGPGPAPWIEKSTLHSLGIQGELINKSCPIDYTHYVKRYANANECCNKLCKELSYREHFHCNALSCNSRVFMKKEEMIRHFKWHKKRDESLTQGFLRCSPGDNCIERFKNCPHHRKQTHYHCLKRGCDKVYISTSDVQMHANYHRKDTAIIQEGFQRFRATENCLLECCAFFGQKTTHFHCRRDNCLHTFKNKADMEKHKSYHVRDEQLARDGFKKFLKHETCPFDDCRSSRVCNHIHCVRSGCTHILHSTGQLYPHKRKHDRCEKELAYRKYLLAQSIHRTNQFIQKIITMKQQMVNRLSTSYGIDLDINLLNIESFEQSLLNKDDDNVFDEIQDQLPLLAMSTIPIEDIIDDDITDRRCAKYIQRHQQPIGQCTFIDDDNDDDDDVGDGDVGDGQNKFIGSDTDGSSNNNDEHYNCLDCNQCFNDQISTLKHARKHVLQEEITSLIFEETNDPNYCNPECLFNQNVRHLHCRMYGCIFTLSVEDKTLKKFEHYKFHEELQCNYSFDSDESAFANLSGYLSMENPPQTPTSSSQSTPPPPPLQQQQQQLTLQPFMPGVTATTSSQSIPTTSITKSKSSMNKSKQISSPLQQLYSSGTNILTSIDGMPILKRKRGRPPKNRSNDMLTTTTTPTKMSKNNSKNNRSTIQPITTASQHTLSSFDFAQAFNLPLNHVQFLANFPQTNDDDLSKTIPIPFIMPYIKSSIHHQGFYVFDEETICPDVTCNHIGRKHFHCSRPRCFFSTNQDDKLVEHSKDFHDNIDILEGFVYFDQNIDCKSDYCRHNHQECHFHCTRIGCNYSFVRYSSMAIHEKEHIEKLRSSSSSSTIDQKTIDDNRSDDDNDDDDDDENDGEFSPMLTIRSSLNDGKFENKQNDDDNDGSDNDLDHVMDKKTNSDEKSEESNNNKDTVIVDRKMMMMMNNKNVNDLNVNNDLSNVTLSTLQQSLQKLFQSRMETESSSTTTTTTSIPSMITTAASTSTTSLPSSSSTINKFDDIIKLHPIYDEQNDQNCQSPFCKLKRRQHLHCNICNQAFTSYDRLIPHFTKHQMIMTSSGMKSESTTTTTPVECRDKIDEISTSSNPLLNPNLTNEFFQLFLNNLMNFPSTTTTASTSSPVVTSSSSTINPALLSMMALNPLLQNVTTKAESSTQQQQQQHLDQHRDSSGSIINDNGIINDINKKQKTIDDENENDDKNKATTIMIAGDESSPNGYARFRFNEDCSFLSCVYREHQTHFHCMRKDCGYSFCDKTRFVQHTARHERLDTLMGGDFQQFRATIDCGHSDCPYSSFKSINFNNHNLNKTSHFHCLKCNYRCSDTNKVVAHRRQHNKMDNILAAGFDKYSSNQDCLIEQCNYKLKQTHYHCNHCNYSVLGLSQMSLHKQKHHQQQQQQQELGQNNNNNDNDNSSSCLQHESPGSSSPSPSSPPLESR
ncbi:Zinc finger protein castor 1 [Dermatophagoides pteronyssinus]|uniref:Zinc finger protein castor 1 n=1 Tax=Dermatophagoides pteronyssinus TaxID=6956 RepID=A0ABQ8IQ55_DERPT|nr:Zinc finger protein castor 1 [Dermatophagoides pteronyssinus]